MISHLRPAVLALIGLVLTSTVARCAAALSELSQRPAAASSAHFLLPRAIPSICLIAQHAGGLRVTYAFDHEKYSGLCGAHAHRLVRMFCPRAQLVLVMPETSLCRVVFDLSVSDINCVDAMRELLLDQCAGGLGAPFTVPCVSVYFSQQPPLVTSIDETAEASELHSDGQSLGMTGTDGETAQPPKPG